MLISSPLTVCAKNEVRKLNLDKILSLRNFEQSFLPIPVQIYHYLKNDKCEHVMLISSQARRLVTESMLPQGYVWDKE